VGVVGSSPIGVASCKKCGDMVEYTSHTNNKGENMSIAELFDKNLQDEKFADLIAEKVIKKLEERETKNDK
jgi:predicted secreted protein